MSYRPGSRWLFVIFGAIAVGTFAYVKLLDLEVYTSPALDPKKRQTPKINSVTSTTGR